MKKHRLFCLLLLFSTTLGFAQQTSNLDQWEWLIGEWKGDGSGQPGQGAGVFSFQEDLDGKILVRKAHSEFSIPDKPTIVHDDLLIVYPGNAEVPSKAIYFDNEGHVINYSIYYVDNNIVLQSEKVGNTPIFRLTYSKIDDQSVNIKFEMSFDGTNFTTHVEGKSIRVSK